jgi:hypothetical protein
VSFEDRAETWIAWARWPHDAYWFFRDTFFELLPEPPGTFERPGLPPMTFNGWVYPLESYSRAFEDAGLVLEALREPATTDAEVQLRGWEKRWQCLPNFLMFRERRS